MPKDAVNQVVTIIGGGLAGSEAAWQIANRGLRVRLHEMRPVQMSPAHETELLGELVCSNSFRSDDSGSAVGLLKVEMEMLDSLIMKTARKTAVPAGKALAVDRSRFARAITREIEGHPLITVHREEVNEINDNLQKPVIIATGPLTSSPMAEWLQRTTGRERLSFYDAIAPIVEFDSLDMEIIYQKSRYDEGPGDYLNCPLDKTQYKQFINELRKGKCVPLHDFEDAKYFEGCLPVEIMCSRGDDTLRFGPMKPVGLADPKTGKDPYGVVQLRKENLAGTHYNMVGFQTKLTYAEQKRIFRLIPGMQNCIFSRYGSIHRNTFICAPEVLQPTLQLKGHDEIFIAGQLSGVEGYIESTAMGLLAGINAARYAVNRELVIPPTNTSLGALINHLTRTESKRFQPSNVNFGLFPPLGRKIAKKLRGQIRAEEAIAAFKHWMAAASI